MSGFNEKLKEIRIYELIVVFALSYLLVMYLNIAESWVYVLIIAYVALRLRSQLPCLKEDLTGIVDKISLKTCLLLTVASYIFALGWGLFFGDLMSTSHSIMSAVSSSDLLMDLAFSVILAPIGEELMFRGILLNRLGRIPVIVTMILCLFVLFYISNIAALAFIAVLAVLFLLSRFKDFNLKEALPLILAIFASSLLFGLLHPYAAMVNTTIFGIVMAVVYLKTENIFAAISIHMMNNLLSFAVSIIPFLEDIFKNSYFMAVIGVLAVLSFVYIAKFIFEGYLEVIHAG